MALTTDAFDATELAAFISETWTPVVQEEYFAKSVAANHFTDLTPYAQAGSDILHVPDVFTNAFSVQSQTTQGAEVTTDAPAQVDVTLTISSHKYISTLLGHLQQQQVASQYDLSAVYGRKMGGTLMEDLEDALLGLWSGLSTNSVGDTATVLSDTEIRQSIEKLATADFDLSECAWFMHPFVYWVQIAGNSRYYVDQTSKLDVIRTGNFGAADRSRGKMGQLYGIDLFTSSRVVSGLQTYRNLLAHKSAFGFAHQTPGGSRVRVQAEPWLANLGILTVAETIYGVAELRDAAAVVCNANNVFIGS